MFKTPTFAFVALLASASFAGAENFISNAFGQQNRDNRIELGTVSADGDGVVEIYAYHRGEVGALLGSEPVRPGANGHFEVAIRRPGTNAIAFLKVGGEIVDTLEIDFRQGHHD